ncbi:hypothetical protein TUM4261_42820 [Shewanella sp. c952]|nr:hypothetical protein TUM4261_42820 [Shewanella sp. c952]
MSAYRWYLHLSLGHIIIVLGAFNITHVNTPPLITDFASLSKLIFKTEGAEHGLLFIILGGAYSDGYGSGYSNREVIIAVTQKLKLQA